MLGEVESQISYRINSPNKSNSMKFQAPVAT